jgi:hypothetical protein
VRERESGCDMSINGNLEDLPFVDVIQLLHVARKSGTLNIESAKGKAAIIVREGDIIGATHPSKTVNLGKILIDMSMITEAQLENAIDVMEDEGAHRKPLMTTLIELGHLRKKQGWDGLRTLIHKTLAEIISWQEGTFHFEVDKIEIDDDFRHIPQDIIDERGGVDIKGALMEALRIFDERNKDQKEREKSDRIKKAREVRQQQQRALALQEDFDVPIREEPEDTLSMRLERFKEAVFLCTDGFIKHSMKTICKENRMFSFISGIEKDILKEIEQCYENETDIVFVADLSNGLEGVSDLGPRSWISLVKRVKTLRPELPLIIISKKLSPEIQMEAFRLKARTVIPIPIRDEGNKAQYVMEMKRFFAVVIAGLASIFKEYNELQSSVKHNRSQIASLKKRILEIQDRKTSPDVSFVVLQYIAEYLERGIIFLVRKQDLLGIGSFGVDTRGDTISTTAMRLKIPLDEPSVFRQVVKTGMVYKGASNDDLLNRHIYSRIGAPESNDVLILPLKTENRTRAVVFGDFGRRDAEPLKVDVFEILASQAGMAIELALQKSRRTKKPSHSDFL